MDKSISSLEIEQSLISLFFTYPDYLKKAYEIGVNEEDFFFYEHKVAFKTMMELYSDGKPVDVASLITELADKKRLGEGYNQVTIDEIMATLDMFASTANFDYYIDILFEKAKARQLIEFIDDIKKKIYEGNDVYETVDETEKKIKELAASRRVSDMSSSEEFVNEALARIMMLSQSKGVTGIQSGFEYLDKITNGFQKSDLIILAARPSVGKTAFALNVAVNAATKYKKSVAIFSLEMSKGQLSNRMLSLKSNVEANKIRDGKGITNPDWAKLDAAADEIKKASLQVEDSALIKVNEIFAKCRKMKNEKGLDLVIVDYLQLISGNRRNNTTNREQEVAEISRSLKQLARELDVPVIALSQLSRKVEDSNREPVLADLRESGSIEQDADIVMFLHREKKKDDEEESELKDIKLIIAKHRNGSIGTVNLAFNGKYSQFYSKVKEN